jgi:predicted Zn-dependent protease
MYMKATAKCLLPMMLGLILAVSGCSEVGLTGRPQFNFVPESLITSMSVQQYTQYLSENQVRTGTADSEMVKRCGERIVAAVDEFCQRNMDHDPFAGYEWEFNLVEDNAVNAFAMPGGKVVVNTGLLPVAQNETGLAVVVGHEIAHVFAKHGSERMSQQLLVQMGGIALSEALKEKPEQTQALFVTSYGLGTQVAMLLPFSRLHENEADRLGLIFMAMAGYDPRVAIDFWERMAAQSEGGQTLEILSTHPIYEKRIANIKSHLPEAMSYYEESQR